jgi:integrase/recombinase XerD
MFLSKRPNGIYYIFTFDEILNKRKCISTRTKHKSKALEFLLNFKSKLTHPKSTILTISEAQQVLQSYAINNLAASTVQIFNKSFNHFKAVLNNKRIDYITAHDLEFFKAQRINQVKKTTVNIELRTLKAMFNILKRFGYITINPFNNVSFFKIEEKEIISFSDEQINTILSAIKEPVFKNLVIFALHTGCRVSEVINIQWSDIDFSNMLITIRNKSNFKTKSGKNRIIPISNAMLQLLNSMRNQQSNIIPINNSQNYLFNTPNYKTKYSRYTITEKFKDCLRMLKFDEKYHFHSLRHTFITNLIKKGVNINFVKELAGHSSISTTMNYVHLGIEDLREAVNNL